MVLQDERQKIDVERLILLPPIFGLTLLNAVGSYNYWTTLDSWTVGNALDSLYRALILAFYVLIVVLLLVRSPARRTKVDRAAHLAAYLGTFAPFLLVFQGVTARPSTELALVSIGLMVVGIGFSVYSVTYLGRSFGATPNARALVTSGPYRLVRHPLYLGEGVALAGLVLGRLSAFSVAVFVLTMAVQFYRMVQEEKVLAASFPEYTAYMAGRKRLIPGVI